MVGNGIWKPKGHLHGTQMNSKITLPKTNIKSPWKCMVAIWTFRTWDGGTWQVRTFSFRGYITVYLPNYFLKMVVFRLWSRWFSFLNWVIFAGSKGEFPGVYTVHPWKLTWNLKITPSNGRNIYKPPIFWVPNATRFHGDNGGSKSRTISAPYPRHPNNCWEDIWTQKIYLKHQTSGGVWMSRFSNN